MYMDCSYKYSPLMGGGITDREGEEGRKRVGREEDKKERVE